MKMKPLSPRQVEVRDLLMRGYSNFQISVMLHISPRTVEDHRSSVMAAYNVCSFIELLSAIAHENPHTACPVCGRRAVAVEAAE